LIQKKKEEETILKVLEPTWYSCRLFYSSRERKERSAQTPKEKKEREREQNRSERVERIEHSADKPHYTERKREKERKKTEREILIEDEKTREKGERI